jgi:hypothetical protein
LSFDTVHRHALSQLVIKSQVPRAGAETCFGRFASPFFAFNVIAFYSGARCVGNTDIIKFTRILFIRLPLKFFKDLNLCLWFCFF